mmetsp:Transcript_12874/g.16922  ORF Transcript_12874/g.16922 Transcript_12874/m.16922 type:complete len:590 (+) Transcript_12874:75-1844(+)|eukprot:CAMPEP_0117751758 /NCGR_PEP_ID=MMETSP0947-20121206/11176_1 /TAXON_ID=44440 /ORGANISM="Chattonella subsalsa, Strain CCMP2191" /LENGTH=589 /DNA_ID=CAMNT_0005570221 /DNA_START=75 /DNA_END=1844 /DNA_ORIENTATION=+
MSSAYGSTSDFSHEINPLAISEIEGSQGRQKKLLLPFALILVTLLFGLATVVKVGQNKSSNVLANLAGTDLIGEDESIDEAQLVEDIEVKTVQSAHPNIVLFFIDDQGFADMGYSSSDLSQFSPVMDAAAKNGIKLGHYYTQDVCTPARAALLTGKYPSRVGMQYAVPDLPEPWGLPAQYEIMPELFKFLGNYKTEIVGKWHLGFFDNNHLPTQRGFDNFFGFYYGKTTYYEHQVYSNDITFNDFHDNEQNFPEALGVHSTYLFENRVEEIIDQHNTADPLFLYYSHQLMHEPMEDPPEEMFTPDEMDMFDMIENEDRRIVAKMLLATDKMFDHLIETLKSKDMYDNTYIIVASDNGGCTYYQGQNYPLRGEKNTLYEGGVRVNAFIHSPLIPQANRGHTYTGLFHVTDWLPTISQGMLGFQTDDIPAFHDMDGMNQWDAILGKSDEPRNEILFNIQQNGNYMLIGYRQGNYKLIYGYQQGIDWYTVDSPAAQNYCEKEFVFSHGSKIFEIPKDATESNDLAKVVDDSILDELWRKIDFHWDRMVDSAYEESDTSCYKLWTDNDYFVMPWVYDNPPVFRGVNKFTPYVH